MKNNQTNNVITFDDHEYPTSVYRNRKQCLGERNYFGQGTIINYLDVSFPKSTVHKAFGLLHMAPGEFTYFDSPYKSDKFKKSLRHRNIAINYNAPDKNGMQIILDSVACRQYEGLFSSPGANWYSLSFIIDEIVGERININKLDFIINDNQNKLNFNLVFDAVQKKHFISNLKCRIDSTSINRSVEFQDSKSDIIIRFKEGSTNGINSFSKAVVEIETCNQAAYELNGGIVYTTDAPRALVATSLAFSNYMPKKNNQPVFIADWWLKYIQGSALEDAISGLGSYSGEIATMVFGNEKHYVYLK